MKAPCYATISLDLWLHDVAYSLQINMSVAEELPSARNAAQCPEPWDACLGFAAGPASDKRQDRLRRIDRDELKDGTDVPFPQFRSLSAGKIRLPGDGDAADTTSGTTQRTPLQGRVPSRMPWSTGSGALSPSSSVTWAGSSATGRRTRGSGSRGGGSSPAHGEEACRGREEICRAVKAVKGRPKDLMAGQERCRAAQARTRESFGGDGLLSLS
ncbi:MAG: hypothetical protein LBR80_06385 [Deltaproteobacteria bacterium]|jgi:hypothetical protein|nr:hypothetical protein [Deltaproteobacteria bacterium]